MSPVNRSGTVAGSSDSLWPGKQKLIGTLLSKDIGKITCAYRNRRAKRKAGHRPWNNSCHVGYIWTSVWGNELNKLYWDTTAGSNGNIWEMLLVHRPQMCSTGIQSHKPRQIQAGIKVVLKQHRSGEKSAHHISKSSYLRWLFRLYMQSNESSSWKKTQTI